MKESESIHANFSCRKFDCRYSDKAIGVVVSIHVKDYEKGFERPQCPNCGNTMISDSEKEITEMLWNAGIARKD